MFPINAVVVESCIKEAEKHFLFEQDKAEGGKTGLIWECYPVGMDWDAARKYCAGQPEPFNQQTAKKAAEVAGQGWRVPAGEELETLLVSICTGRKINTVAFPSTEVSDFGEGTKF